MPCGCTDKLINKRITNQSKLINNNKKLSLEFMKDISIDEIIRLYQNGYKLEGSEEREPISPLLSPLELGSPKIGGLSPANCPTTNVIQGTQKTITIAFPGGVVGGVSPYIYHFYRDNTEIYASSPPTTASSHQFQYAFNQAGDTTGLHRYLTNVTDNCSAGSQTSGTDYCDIWIQAPITVGSVIFHTNPVGAHIIIGGTDIGQTSLTDGTLTVNNLLMGDLVYDVTLSEYNPSTGNHVTVVANTTTNAPLITLTPTPPATGSVEFHTNPGQAEIWKGATRLCTTNSSGVCTVSNQDVGTLT